MDALKAIATIQEEIKNEIEYCKAVSLNEWKHNKEYMDGFVRGLDHALLLLNKTEDFIMGE